VERRPAHTTGALSQGYPPDRIRENSHSILNPPRLVLRANFFIGYTLFYSPFIKESFLVVGMLLFVSACFD
jgi:hypothetical protein